MADNEVRIEVTGVRELNSAFRSFDKTLNKKLRDGFLDIATEIVDDVRSKIPDKLRTAVKARATQKSAGIAFNGGESTDPQAWYPWWDFGGSTGRGHQVGVADSGAVKREIVKGGRFIYPTIEAHHELTIQMIDDTIAASGRESDLEMR